MNENNILIVSGYHPKENFAVGAGEFLLENLQESGIKVVRYSGKSDKDSIRNLRRFIDDFGPMSLPIVLHSDNHFNVKLGINANINAVIIYYVKSKEEKKKILEPLFDFVFKYNKRSTTIIFDIVLLRNAKNNLIEIELNPKMGLKKAVNLVKNFSKYLIDLQLDK